MEAALKRSGLRLEAARRYSRYQSPSRLPGLDEGENK
jgi:hypothetical protein